MKKSLPRLVFFMFILYLTFFPFFILDAYGLTQYTLTVKALDSGGTPLNGALIRVTVTYGIDDQRSFYNETDGNGLAVFTLEAAEPSALVRIIWKGVTVALKDVYLHSPQTSVTLYCNVSDLNILVLQANNNPIKNARVSLNWQIDIPWTVEVYSNTDGVAVFKQMPHYDGYSLSVKWKGKTVYQTSLSFNGETQPFQAKCSVYDLTVTVLDKLERPISGAQTTLTWDEARQEDMQTGENGKAVFTQLVAGNYTLRIDYGTETFQTVISLTSDEEIEVKLNTTILLNYYLEVNVKWSDGLPAKNVNIEVWNTNGEKVAHGATDGLGVFKKQLIEGNYTVKIVIEDYTDSQEIVLNNNLTVEFTVNIDYRLWTVTVEFLDEKGNPAGGALVVIYSNNQPVASGVTSPEGRIMFTLPDGTYQVVATYNGEGLETTISVSGDKNLRLSLYNPPTPSELVIGIGILIAAVTVIFVLILYAVQRGERNGKTDFQIKELKKLKLD